MIKTQKFKRGLSWQGVMKWAFGSPDRTRRALNAWPPLTFSGLRITEISHDWKYARIEFRDFILNRNFNSAMFGGTTFSMTDLLFGALLSRRIGEDFEVWTRTATIQFLSPGRHGAAHEVHVTDEIINWVLKVVEEDGYVNVPYTSQVINKDGSVVAIAQQDMHVRPRRNRRPDLARAKNPAHARSPRGLVLESLATAVVWHSFRDDPAQLTELMSAQRRIAEPAEQMRFVCHQTLSCGGATKKDLLDLGVPAKYLEQATDAAARTA